jgi:hypothetical protein
MSLCLVASQGQIVIEASRNSMRNQILTDADDNTGHNATKLKLYDLSFKTGFELIESWDKEYAPSLQESKGN